MPTLDGWPVHKGHNTRADRDAQQNPPKSQRRILTQEEARADWLRRQELADALRIVKGRDRA